MKLTGQTKAGSKYELSRGEGACLKSLLQQFPVTASTHARISKTDIEPASVEREKLLNESLAEHRATLKKLAVNLPAKLKRGETGYLLTLGPEEREIMLQILNDIRVGCWHVLGEPEELEPETMPESEREQVFCNVMNVAGYFEAAFLRDASGDPKPAMIERNLFRPVLLGENIRFPNPEFSDAEGMVAVGGDLKVERLLAAYRQGIFPWTVNPITWWSPDPRGIIELDHLHVSESLARVIRRRTFEVTIDRAFKEVMQACAAPGPNRRSTWITGEFIEAYTLLHQQGHAHSVECWKNGELAGGIYGVSVGGLFAGESMFHLADNASKVALCHLVGHLRERQFLLFDIQMVTAATLLLGAKAIPRSEYLKRLGVAVTKDCPFS